MVHIRSRESVHLDQVNSLVEKDHKKQPDQGILDELHLFQGSLCTLGADDSEKKNDLESHNCLPSTKILA